MSDHIKTLLLPLRFLYEANTDCTVNSVSSSSDAAAAVSDVVTLSNGFFFLFVEDFFIFFLFFFLGAAEAFLLAADAFLLAADGFLLAADGFLLVADALRFLLFRFMVLALDALRFFGVLAGVVLGGGAADLASSSYDTFTVQLGVT